MIDKALISTSLNVLLKFISFMIVGQEGSRSPRNASITQCDGRAEI